MCLWNTILVEDCVDGILHWWKLSWLYIDEILCLWNTTYWRNIVLVEYCIGEILYWWNTMLVQYCLGEILYWLNIVLVKYFKYYFG